MNLYITKEQLLALTVGNLNVGESLEYGITQEEIITFTKLLRDAIYSVKSDFTICYDIPYGDKIYPNDKWRHTFRFFLNKYYLNSYDTDRDLEDYKIYISAQIRKLILDLDVLGIPEEVASNLIEKAMSDFITKHYEEIDEKNKVNYINQKENKVTSAYEKKRYNLFHKKSKNR